MLVKIIEGIIVDPYGEYGLRSDENEDELYSFFTDNHAKIVGRKAKITIEVETE